MANTSRAIGKFTTFRSDMKHLVFFFPCPACFGRVHGQAFEMLAVITAMFGYQRLVQESMYYIRSYNDHV